MTRDDVSLCASLLRDLPSIKGWGGGGEFDRIQMIDSIASQRSRAKSDRALLQTAITMTRIARSTVAAMIAAALSNRLLWDLVFTLTDVRLFGSERGDKGVRVQSHSSSRTVGGDGSEVSLSWIRRKSAGGESRV